MRIEPQTWYSWGGQLIYTLEGKAIELPDESLGAQAWRQGWPPSAPPGFVVPTDPLRRVWFAVQVMV